MANVVLANPFRCRLWDFHDRLDVYLDESNCRAEIASFSRHGQLIPVLGRRLAGEQDYDFELYLGARRLFVARHLKCELSVEIRDLTTRDALIAMDIENRQRTDVSPYERGLSYSRWLRAGLFKSQDDIAHSFHMSASQVSRLLRLARLPAVIVGAFANPRDIREAWGLEIADALDDTYRRQLTINKARAISKRERKSLPEDIYRELLSASVNGRRPRAAAPHDDVVKDGRGNPLFRIRKLRNYIGLLLPVDSISEEKMSRIRLEVSSILDKPADSSAGAAHRSARHSTAAVITRRDVAGQGSPGSIGSHLS